MLFILNFINFFYPLLFHFLLFYLLISFHLLIDFVFYKIYIFYLLMNKKKCIYFLLYYLIVFILCVYLVLESPSFSAYCKAISFLWVHFCLPPLDVSVVPLMTKYSISLVGGLLRCIFNKIQVNVCFIALLSSSLLSGEQQIQTQNSFLSLLIPKELA